MFTLSFETSNAAFETNEDARREVVRILETVAKHLRTANRSWDNRQNDVFDINGNSIGTFQYGRDA